MCYEHIPKRSFLLHLYKQCPVVRYPDRYLLLKHIADDKFEVVDFPDIRRYDEEKAFYTYKMNPAGLEYFTGVVSDLIAEVNNWKSVTGDEFLIDTKMYRFGYRKNKA
jgi:hypothetical protein